MVYIFHHGEIGPRPLPKKQQLLSEIGRWQTSESGIFPFLASLSEGAMTSGANFIDFLSIIQICARKIERLVLGENALRRGKKKQEQYVKK